MYVVSLGVQVRSRVPERRELVERAVKGTDPLAAEEVASGTGARVVCICGSLERLEGRGATLKGHGMLVLGGSFPVPLCEGEGVVLEGGSSLLCGVEFGKGVLEEVFVAGARETKEKVLLPV